MRKEILVATVIFLIGLSVQQCTIGCLKCNNQNQCLLCDITQNYQLSATTCRLNTQTNCAVFSQSGNCVQCSPNFYMDINSQNCIAVGTANVIANCRNYNSAQACVLCSNNHFLIGGNCGAVNSTIPNCQTYSANGVCTSCVPSFLLSNDYATCVALPSNSNCLFYSYIGCRQCNSGFVVNFNNYFTNFNSPTYLNSYLTNIVSPSTQWVGLSVCQPVTVTNCAVFTAFNICARCHPGYYLSNGSCFLFPLNTIFGCSTYGDLVTCSSCQAGLFLSQNTCQPNSIILNCSTYSTSASTTTCLVCTNNFFLQGNSCAARIASRSIPNCQEAHPIADLCRTCSTGFTLTGDSLSCLPTVPNCAQYSPSTLQTAALQCSLCNNNFYLSSTGSSVNCVPGTIASCSKYQVSQNVCIECVNGFYLSNLACVAHVNIPNCVSYHNSKFNHCATCASGFFSFAYTTVCVQTTVRANCAVYRTDGNSCDKCVPNYYLVSGACNAIPSTFANCNIYSGTACTLCNSGYMVNTLPTAGTCILPLDYINSSVNSPCSVMKRVGASEVPIWMSNPGVNQVRLECLTCGDYMYGYNPNNAEAICVNQNQLTFYSGFIAINQCKRYGLNYAASQSVVCMECNSGLYITGYHLEGVKAAPYQLISNPNGIQCTTTCNFASTSSSAVITDDFFGFVNICVTGGTIGFTTIAAFVATGIVQFPGTCRRYARYRYMVNDRAMIQARMTTLGVAAADTAAAQIVSSDFLCLMPAPSTSASTVMPTNYLFVGDADTTAALQYRYEVVSLTTARTSEPSGTVGFDFSTGYSNTVDSTSTHPTVFNYKGILEGIRDSNVVSPTACTNCKHNYAFCDIFVRYSGNTNKKGKAFDTAATANAAFYTPTTFPAAATDFIFVCLRCQFGYQLSYTASAVADNASMPSCVSMQNCASSTTVYGGLTTFLNSIFSCHLCGQTSGSTTFPSIWIETDSVTDNTSSGTFVGWKVAGVYTSATALNAGHGFKCFSAPSSIFSGASTVTIPNCAAYGYITPVTVYPTNAPADATVLTERAICVACAANTYPTYARGTSTEMDFTNAILADANNRLPGWTVTACNASQNCDTSVINIYNSCAKCDTSKENLPVPIYYAYMDFTLSNCYQATTQNCFILATGSSQTGQNTCDVCKAGFILNDDRICEKFRVPNQSITSSSFNSGWFARRILGSNTALPVLPPSAAADATTAERVRTRINYLLSFGQHQYGVTSCQSGWIQFPVNLMAPRVCMWSSYIYNNTQFPSTTQYINNCLRYNVTQINNRHVCGGCNVGFIPTIDGTSCVSSNPLPNCVFAQSGANTALCYECMDNFFNVNGQCTNAPIANCRSYVNTKWSFVTPSVLQCLSCLNGFVLSADSLSCTAGNVNNCIIYKQGTPTQCTECADQFSLMTLANNVYYCYPLPSSLNCLKMQASSATSGLNYDTISCSICNYNTMQVFGTRMWTSLGFVNQPQTLCMQFTQIPFCKVYDQAMTKITDNTFGCLECNTGYWYSVSNQTCLIRSNNPSQCVTFSATSDVCLVCGPGSFLNSAKTACVPFPNGIFMCSQYSSATTCTQCSPGFYLSSNSCIQSTLITNCLVYVANFTCSACNTGLFLFNSTSCVAATATNCLTFTSITACGSCAVGFGLQTTNGITSCVTNNLPNCINATSVAPFTCLICANGYFPNPNGVCTLVSKAIVNCIAYDTASTCLTCTVGSVLNVARTACNSTFYTSLVDPNCMQSFLTPTPNCVQCALGSFFSNGTCVQCTNNTYASGCMSCDPLNMNICLVCRPNFYMNSIGACISVNPTTPVDNGPEQPNKKSAVITKAIALSMTLAALYFEDI